MDQGFLNPFLTHKEEYNEQEKMEQPHDEKGESSTRKRGQPECKGKREVEQYGNDDHTEHDCQGEGCE